MLDTIAARDEFDNPLEPIEMKMDAMGPARVPLTHVLLTPESPLEHTRAVTGRGERLVSHAYRWTENNL